MGKEQGSWGWGNAVIKSLQIGRALAALAVAAFHLSIAFSDPRYGHGKIFADFTGRGSLGVDFFFVLSGFIMMYAHHKDIDKRQRLGNYAVKRFVRLYPLYWLVTALVLLGSAITGGVNRPPSHLGDIMSTVFLIRFTEYAAPIGVSWTLYHEVLFYAIFSLLLINRKLGLAALISWFLIILYNFNYTHHGDWNFRNVIVSAANLSFFFGIGAYFLRERLRGIATYTAALSGLAIFFATCFIDNHYPGLGFMQIGFSFAFMLLIAGTVALERDGRIRDIPLLSLIGNASYTLYLCHESIESLLLKIASKLHIMDTVDHRLIYVIILAITIISSIIFYKIVERPLLKAVNFGLGIRRTPVASMQTAPAN